DLVYFDAVAMLDVDLGVADRKKLHELIAAALSGDRAPSRIEMGPVFEVRLDRVTKDAERKLARFESWTARLVSDEAILGGSLCSLRAVSPSVRSAGCFYAARAARMCAQTTRTCPSRTGRSLPPSQRPTRAR